MSIPAETVAAREAVAIVPAAVPGATGMMRRRLVIAGVVIVALLLPLFAHSFLTFQLTQVMV